VLAVEVTPRAVAQLERAARWWAENRPAAPNAIADDFEEAKNLQRRPTHPGEVLREDVLPALAMTQGEFARRLGVSRLTVSELLHEKRAVSPDMAMRLGKLLGNGPEIWLRMQHAVDLWELEQRGGYEDIETLQAA
jgi:antitoxin HigA-1